MSRCTPILPNMWRVFPNSISVKLWVCMNQLMDIYYPIHVKEIQSDNCIPIFQGWHSFGTSSFPGGGQGMCAVMSWRSSNSVEIFFFWNQGFYGTNFALSPHKEKGRIGHGWDPLCRTCSCLQLQWLQKWPVINYGKHCDRSCVSHLSDQLGHGMEIPNPPNVYEDDIVHGQFTTKNLLRYVNQEIMLHHFTSF